MVSAPINHINLDERGVAYIAGTSLRVAHIAIDSQTWHLDAEQIEENFPALTLAQIHAALAYYFDHKEQIDVQIAEGVTEYESARSEFPNPLTRQQFIDRDPQRKGRQAAG